MMRPRDDLLATIDRNRRRIWALCYRMTGNRADADDLAQESIARALERRAQISDDATGWLTRLACRVCLDHLRRAKVRRRLTELVDPLDGEEWIVDARRPSADNALVLQDEIRYAIVVALQRLSPKQRASVLLRDVCGLSLSEIAATLESNENAVKALLQRARVVLAEARGRPDVDVPPDAEVVERFARAVRAGSIEGITALLAEDVWGVVDGGGVIVTANKPTFGRRTVSRQWTNAKEKLGVPVLADVVRVNGEPAVRVRLQASPEIVVALAHLETRSGLVVAQRVLRDPARLGRYDSTVTAER